MQLPDEPWVVVGWWVTVISAAVTGLVASSAIIASIWLLFGRNSVVVWVLRRARRRTTERSLRRLGLPTSTVHALGHSLIVARLTGRRSWSVIDELRWLDNLCAPDDQPVTYAGVRGWDRQASLRLLSAAYAELHARLDSRVVVSAGQVPAVHDEAELARGVSHVLASYAQLDVKEADWQGYRRVVVGPHLALDILTAPSDAAGTWPEQCTVSHVGIRQIPPLTTARERAKADGVTCATVEATEVEIEKTNARLDEPHRFDGILPVLQEARYERDSTSGRGRLHLLVSETSYSALLLSSYGGRAGAGRAWASESASPTVGGSGLLTLALMLETTDGWLVGMRRADLPPSGRCWAPAVDGNIEIGARMGIGQDVDENGLLDPAAAIIRETREELGIQLESALVRCIGLARFGWANEWGTHVLCFVAQAGLDVDEVRRALLMADPVEGRFELGDRLLMLPWREPGDEAPRLLEWAAKAPHVAPHLVGCLAALTYGHTGHLPAPFRRVGEGDEGLPADIPAGARVVPTVPPEWG